MKILILTESYLPYIGGVEKHIAGTLPYFKRAGHQVEIISKKALLAEQKVTGLTGLIKIWLAIAKQIVLIREADLVIIHDVFIYYLPFKILFPNKKIITVFHGWEKIYPIPRKNVFYKHLAQKLSNKTISIGQYINQYYRLSNKNNYLSYGAVELPKIKIDLKNKQKNSFLFVGRLEKDTGLSIFLDFLEILSKKKIIFTVQFCGDGPMKKQCQIYGKVLGFIDTASHLKKSSVCFVGGYLSALEAMAYKNYVLAAYQNNLKKDYWLKSPFAKRLALANNDQELFENYLKMLKKDGLLVKNYQMAMQYDYQRLADLYFKIIAQL